MRDYGLKSHPRSESIQDEEEEQDIKRMRMMENNQKKAGNSTSHLIAVVDQDLVVLQILSRLPVKSLMRFKCICKGWKFIIEHDSHFINLHYAHSQERLPGLLIVPHARYISESSGVEWSFFSAEFHCDDDSDGGRKITGGTIHRFGRRTIKQAVKYFGPVRGLLCLVDDQHAVQIYNASTGQAVTPWVRSAEAMNRKCKSRKCQFGFDPSTGKHKVIFMWSNPAVCEVLTVGVDARWRIIDDVPPCKINGDFSTYANGSIYWITSTGHLPFCEGGPGLEEYSEFLMAFDVGCEKFRMIRIPRFTFGGGLSPSPYTNILEMDGCITVVRQGGGENHTVKMWRFHDYNKQEINGTSSNEAEQDWSEVTVKLPPCVVHNWLCPIGKDLMILVTYNPRRRSEFQNQNRNREVFASFYSYNMINKTFSKFKMQGSSSITGWRMHVCDTFTEGLFSATSVS